MNQSICKLFDTENRNSRYAALLDIHTNHLVIKASESKYWKRTDLPVVN